MLKLIYFLIVVSCGIWTVVFACNGYNILLKKLEPCAEDNVIKLSDINATLDKECNLIPKGCAEIKEFNTAKVSYKVIKNPFPPLQGEIDMCEIAKDHGEKVEVFLDMFSLPKSCPIKNSKICAPEDKPINLSKYKSKLGMALGKIDMMLNITHDTGITCYDISVEVTRTARKAKGSKKSG